MQSKTWKLSIKAKEKNDAMNHNTIHKNLKRSFWMFIAPCATLFTIFFLVPLALNFFFSLTNYDGWKTMEFIGLQNYVNILSDPQFYAALRRTMTYAVLNLPFRIAIPLLFAMLLTSPKIKYRTIIRTLIYLPVLLSSLVVGITINWMFSQTHGLINFIIEALGGTGLEWGANPILAMIVVSIASNWAAAGFFMIIYIGAINNISEDIYEAASVDGVNGFQRFFKITFPLLAPTTFLVILLSTVNLLREFALVQGITQGGPGTSTTFIVQYIFNTGFTQHRYGYASAAATIVMFIFAFIAFVQFKISNGGDN